MWTDRQTERQTHNSKAICHPFFEERHNNCNIIKKKTTTLTLTEPLPHPTEINPPPKKKKENKTTNNKNQIYIYKLKQPDKISSRGLHANKHLKINWKNLRLDFTHVCLRV